jgi:hypothetical protein
MLTWYNINIGKLLCVYDSVLECLFGKLCIIFGDFSEIIFGHFGDFPKIVNYFGTKNCALFWKTTVHVYEAFIEALYSLCSH